jgi:hypothetical protein
MNIPSTRSTDKARPFLRLLRATTFAASTAGSTVASTVLRASTLLLKYTRTYFRVRREKNLGLPPNEEPHQGKPRPPNEPEQ